MQKTCTKFSIYKVKLKPQFVWASWLLILSMITLLIGCTKMDKAESKSYQVMQRFAKIQKKEGFYLGSVGGSMKLDISSAFMHCKHSGYLQFSHILLIIKKMSVSKTHSYL